MSTWRNGCSRGRRAGAGDDGVHPLGVQRELLLEKDVDIFEPGMLEHLGQLGEAVLPGAALGRGMTQSFVSGLGGLAVTEVLRVCEVGQELCGSRPKQGQKGLQAARLLVRRRGMSWWKPVGVALTLFTQYLFGSGTRRGGGGISGRHCGRRCSVFGQVPQDVVPVPVSREVIVFG